MALAGVDVELRYGWREWVKTPTGWVLAAHEHGANPRGETSNSAVKSNVAPKCRSNRSRTNRNYDIEKHHPIIVRGTRGQRQVSVCLSDMLKFLDIHQSATEVARSAYVYEVLMVLMKSYLNKVSGTTHRLLFQILHTITQQALETEQHIDKAKILLVTALKSLIESGTNRVGCSAVWNKHIQTVTNLSTKLEEFQYTPREEDGNLILTDLPKECIIDIMLRLDDHRDLLHLGQCSLDLYYMSLDTLLWERLAQTHFTEKQMLSVMSEKDFGEGTDWCSVHQKCYKKYGLKKNFADMIVLCTKCKVLHWLMSDHVCWGSEEQAPDTEQISPDELIQFLGL